MLSTETNRKTRRLAAKAKAGTAAKAMALTGTVAVTAAALTSAITPATTQADVQKINVALTGSTEMMPYTCGESPHTTTCYPYATWGVGVLGGMLPTLLDAMKMNPLSNVLAQVGYDFLGNAATTKGLYNKINALDYIPVSEIANGTCKEAEQTACRTTFIITTGIGSFGVTDTIHALNEAATGHTRSGYDDLKAVPNGSGLTQVSAIYLNNMFRPNGGIASRFPKLMELFGLHPNMPTTGEVGANADDSSVFSWITDFTWAYNTLADFPITASPLALLNSLFAAVPPPELIQQLQTPGGVFDKLTAVFTSAAGTLTAQSENPLASLPSETQCGNDICGYTNNALLLVNSAASGNAPYPFQTSYTMTGANRTVLPILYPAYIASDLINPLLKKINSPYLVGTPLADILAPALKILINTAYSDIVTPDMLDTIDEHNLSGLTYAQEGYVAYDRTFYQTSPDSPTPFAWFKNPEMTADQTKAARQAAVKAFTDALKAQAQKPLFGILVPNTIPDSSQSAPAASSAQAAVPQSAAAEAAPVVSEPAPAVSEPAPVVSEPAPAVTVSAPVVSEPAPAVSEPAPVVSEPAPAVSESAPAVSEPAPAVSEPDIAPVADSEPAAPTAPAATASQAGSSDNGNGGSTTRAHRGGGRG